MMNNIMIWRLCIVILSVVLLGGICAAEDRVKLSEIQSSIVEGIDRQVVETFFQDHRIEYGFVPRASNDVRVPPFPWKHPDAVGFYVGTIRNVKTRWWMLASEHITIRVEIDPSDRVSQVIVRREYTGP